MLYARVELWRGSREELGKGFKVGEYRGREEG
jgi:hypothetical protein